MKQILLHGQVNAEQGFNIKQEALTNFPQAELNGLHHKTLLDKKLMNYASTRKKYYEFRKKEKACTDEGSITDEGDH